MNTPKDKAPAYRYRDWSIRWVEFMHDCQQLQHELILNWEDMNCIKWACMGVEAITGQDLYAPFEDAKGVIGAAKRIRAEGFNTLDELVSSYFHEVPIGMAQQGDMVLVRATQWTEDQDNALVMPHGVALADPPFYWVVTPEGLGRGDLYTDGVKAFAVGRIS